MNDLSIYSPHFQKLLHGFENAVKAKGYYRGKNVMYPTYTREFLHYVENKGIMYITEVKAGDMVMYHDYLKERPNQRRAGGLAEATIRDHITSIQMFFDYLIDIKEVNGSPVRIPKFKFGKAEEKQVATVEEIKQIYNACKTRRDRAIISVAYGCGLRRTEIEKLDVNDVLLHKGILVVKDGKGGKSRTIPLSDSVINDFRDYLINERQSYLKEPYSTQAAFFIDNQGERMLGYKYYVRLKQLIAMTKNPEIKRKGISLHNLRHSIATHLFDKGATIEFVQKFLGHTKMDTSLIYSNRRKRQLAIINAMR